MQEPLLLTKEERNILLNLIMGEFNNIKNLNGNIYFKLESYQKELHTIYKKIVDNYEDEDEE